MKEKTILFHKEVGEHAEAFHENLKTHANQEFDTFQERLANMEGEPDEDDEEFNSQLELLGEKEGLDAILEQFKEFMDAQINQKEGQIDKAIKADQKETEDGIINGQHKRNRGIIKEIISTCTTFKSEIKQDFDLIRGEDDD